MQYVTVRPRERKQQSKNTTPERPNHMTNWKADPKVIEAQRVADEKLDVLLDWLREEEFDHDTQAQYVTDYARAENALCEAVAASGSPPAPLTQAEIASIFWPHDTDSNDYDIALSRAGTLLRKMASPAAPPNAPHLAYSSSRQLKTRTSDAQRRALALARWMYTQPHLWDHPSSREHAQRGIRELWEVLNAALTHPAAHSEERP